MNTHRYLAMLLLGAMFLPVYSATATDNNNIAPNEATVKVSGAVCSFCTLGIQKKLSKLPYVDTSKYNKGSLMDIESHRLTIAIKPDSALNLGEVYQMVLDGGYEPRGAAVASLDGDIVHYDGSAQKCSDTTAPC